MGKRLIIVGTSAFGEIAYEYFTHSSDYEVVGFSAEREFIDRTELCGLPVVPFEELESNFDPAGHSVFVALVYTQLNRPRTRLFLQARQKGYSPASFVSPHAFVWRNVSIGENCFIFEDNTLQPFVKIGDNVILWSGNHIGHHSVVRDNCFLSSHVVISGFCDIGENSYLGVNSTVANNITIARDCFVDAGTVIRQDTEEGKVYRGNPAEAHRVGSLRLFRVPE